MERPKKRTRAGRAGRSPGEDVPAAAFGGAELVKLGVRGVLAGGGAAHNQIPFSERVWIKTYQKSNSLIDRGKHLYRRS
jgi:hypothetical protein